MRPTRHQTAPPDVTETLRSAVTHESVILSGAKNLARLDHPALAGQGGPYWISTATGGAQTSWLSPSSEAAYEVHT